MFEKRLEEIKKRKEEIRKFLEDGNSTVDLAALETELRNLDTEKKHLEARQKALDELNGGAVPTVTSADATPTGGVNPTEPTRITNPIIPEQRSISDQNAIYRSAFLKTLQGKPLTPAEQRAYTTAAGSALPAIPETTAGEIIKKMYEVAPILAKCKIYHIPGNFKFPIENVNEEAALHAELAAITPAADSLTSLSLTGYEIVKVVKASMSSSEMTINAFESYLVETISESVARRIEKYIFTGTGSGQPGGVGQGGKGASGVYADGTDQVSVATGVAVTESDVVKLYGMLGSGYERDAIWTMSKNTFFSYFYSLMNKSKNNVIEFANGKYYIMGSEVYFTGSLAAGVVYYGNFGYIIGNYSQDITILKSEHSGFITNTIDYRGSCIFDSKAVSGLGAFVKMVKTP